MISGFHCQVDENCVLVGYCTVSNSNSLPTFWETIGPVFKGLDLDPGKMGSIDCPKKWVRYYHYSLHYNPEEHCSQAQYGLVCDNLCYYITWKPIFGVESELFTLQFVMFTTFYERKNNIHKGY